MDFQNLHIMLKIYRVLHEPVEKLFPIPDSTGIDKPDGSQKNK